MGVLNYDDEEWDYGYDGYNRLINVDKDSNNIADYTFNMLGNRVKKYVYSSAETTKMLYDGYDCVADYNLGDTLQRYYITPMLDENLLVYDDAGDDEEYFYLHDGLGTVRQILDASQNVENQYDYEGFGTSLGSTESIYNRFRYTDRAIDTETESANSTALYYYRARTYDSTIGSFTSRDPIPARNLYPYCAANPVIHTDPLGQQPKPKFPTTTTAVKTTGKTKIDIDVDTYAEVNINISKVRKYLVTFEDDDGCCYFRKLASYVSVKGKFRCYNEYKWQQWIVRYDVHHNAGKKAAGFATGCGIGRVAMTGAKVDPVTLKTIGAKSVLKRAGHIGFFTGAIAGSFWAIIGKNTTTYTLREWFPVELLGQKCFGQVTVYQYISNESSLRGPIPCKKVDDWLTKNPQYNRLSIKGKPQNNNKYIKMHKNLSTFWAADIPYEDLQAELNSIADSYADDHIEDNVK